LLLFAHSTGTNRLIEKILFTGGYENGILKTWAKSAGIDKRVRQKYAGGSG
jgi:hypothetical protein